MTTLKQKGRHLMTINLHLIEKLIMSRPSNLKKMIQYQNQLLID